MFAYEKRGDIEAFYKKPQVQEFLRNAKSEAERIIEEIIKKKDELTAPETSKATSPRADLRSHAPAHAPSPAAPAPQKAGHAFARVESAPQGAAVFELKGKKRSYLGRTPLDIDVQDGSHRLIISKKGFHAQEAEASKENTSVKADLKPLKRRIVLTPIGEDAANTEDAGQENDAPGDTEGETNQ